MKKNEFIEEVSCNYGYYTAYVYDSPNNRYQYTSGEFTDDHFDDAPEDGYQIVGINDVPEVKKVIADNFLAELEPAPDVEDEAYNELRDMIVSGKANVGYWTDESGETTYILLYN